MRTDLLFQSADLLFQSADSCIIACAVWLLTYLLHSTLLLGSAWLATRCGRRAMNESIKELIWKAAVLGGIITASIQVGAGMTPFSGSILLEAPRSVEITGDIQSEHSEKSFEKDAGHEFSHFDESRSLSEWRDQSTNRRAARGENTPEHAGLEESGTTPAANQQGWRGNLAAVDDPGPAWWLRLMIVAVLTVMAASVILAVRTRRVLLMQLACREVIGTGVLHSMLERLCMQSGKKRPVRLTVSPQISVPLALGIYRHEICLPERALSDLSRCQQEAMLAHELAHLIRRDPAWQTLAHLVGCVFFFQPLNRVVLRRLRESAEFSCDALSAEMIDQPLALAQCLTEVAGWVTARRWQPAAAAAVEMAGAPSVLARRIEILLNGRRIRAWRIGRFWSIAAPTLILAAVTAIAPAVEAVVPPGDGHAVPEKNILEPLITSLRGLDSEIAALERETAALEVNLRKLGHDETLIGEDLMKRLDRELARLRVRRQTLRERVERLETKTDVHADR